MTAALLEARTIGIAVDRPWRDVYEAIWRPERFSIWASGLIKSSLEPAGDWWRAEGPAGPIRIRFTERNPFGVMDHTVDLGSGPEIYVPLRVIQNGTGAEVLLTLFRQPGMSETAFLTDLEWAQQDLLALRAMAET